MPSEVLIPHVFHTVFYVAIVLIYILDILSVVFFHTRSVRYSMIFHSSYLPLYCACTFSAITIFKLVGVRFSKTFHSHSVHEIRILPYLTLHWESQLQLYSLVWGLLHCPKYHRECLYTVYLYHCYTWMK